MNGDRVERRLAAILAADVVGYTRLMGEDEEGTLAALKAIWRDLSNPRIQEHRGRIVKTTGDGLLVEFASVVDAVRCAVDIQSAMAERNIGVAAERCIEFRIGVHQCDVIVEDGDIFGDRVNLAARLEGIAEPGGICVSGRVRSDVAGKLDISFDDLGLQRLKNIARPVRSFAIRFGGGRKKVPTTAEYPTSALPGKPSIAVLPFQNMSGDPEQEYFADGMAEEIITALSRIRWLSVMSRNSSFSYKGQSPDLKVVGRELNVRYVFEGSVRRGGNRVRITGQLIDAATGAHLWADRFDGSLEDVFDLQDRVAMSVAGAIEPTLQAAETTRLAGRPTQDLAAYDLFLRAQAIVWSSAWQVPEVLGLMEQVIVRDPKCAPALAWAGICCLRLHEDGRNEDLGSVAERGMDLARRALEGANDDPTTLANAALTLAYFGEDIGAMMAIVDRSLALNPSSARGWYINGVLNLWAGHCDIAIQHLESSMRLSPRARVGNSPHVIGAAHFFARRFDEAVPRLLLAIQEDPGYAQPYRYLAAYHAQTGRLDAAREVIARLRAITPVVIPPSSPLRNADHRQLFLSSLRLAIGESQ